MGKSRFPGWISGAFPGQTATVTGKSPGADPGQIGEISGFWNLFH